MGIRESIGSFGVRKAIAVLAVVTSFTGLGFSQSQLVVSAPPSRDNVKACADYADQVLHDRWDMANAGEAGEKGSGLDIGQICPMSRPDPFSPGCGRAPSSCKIAART